jgi:type I restriction enzyme S subunit
LSNHLQQARSDMSAPKLRFKEFKSAYSEVSLGSIGEFKNGINKSKEDFGFGVPFVNLMDVFGKPFLTQSGFGLVNASAKEVDSYSLIKGDVLFIRSSVKPEGVGETSTILEDFANTVYSGFLIRFRETSPEKMLDINYKKYCFSIKSFRKQIMSLCTTSANTNINQDSLNGLKISIPNREEQCKIALFLSKIDQKIFLLTQKHELFIQYKKGVMQKIFNQEIRFKDGAGKDFPNWDYVPLEEVLDYEQPGRYLVSSPEYSDDFETPVLTAGKTFLLG